MGERPMTADSGAHADEEDDEVYVKLPRRCPACEVVSFRVAFWLADDGKFRAKCNRCGTQVKYRERYLPSRPITADSIREYVVGRIDDIEDDERLSYDSANVQINAPLALHQTAQEAKLRELRGVLRRLDAICGDGDSEGER